MGIIHDLIALAMLTGAIRCFYGAARDFVIWHKGKAK